MTRILSTAAALILAAGAFFAYLAWANGPSGSVPRTGDEQVSSAETYTLRSTQASGTCAVTRGNRLSAERSALLVDPSCAALLPGVEKARYWVDKDDGSVAFTGDGVDTIVTFGIADGVAYESLKPSQPVISLDAGTGVAEVADTTAAE